MLPLLAMLMIPMIPDSTPGPYKALPINHTAEHKVPYESVNQSERLFDDERSHTIRGTIADTKTMTLEGGEPFMQMDLKTDNGTVVVHLAPVWFMEDRKAEFDFDKGRTVSVLGSRSQLDGKDVFVASEVTAERGDQRLRLRHPGGVPAWAGSERVP